MMIRKLSLCLFALLFMAGMAMAQDADKGKGKAEGKVSDAKEMSGMSIVGSDEAPKSLYIVPWKSSEVGVETSLNAMLSDNDVPVDRDVFKRQIEFYKVSKAESVR